jgi:hypothetical protein
MAAATKPVWLQAWPLTTNEATKQAEAKSLDDCVRMVTAFRSFDDMKASQPTYAPTFYRRGMSHAEQVAQKRVAAAFNAWAVREGRERRAEVRS